MKARTEKRADEMPLLKALIKEEPAKRTRYSVELYDAIRKINMQVATARFYGKIEEPEKAKSYVDPMPKWSKLYGDAKAASKVMAGYRQALGALHSTKDWQRVETIAAELAGHTPSAAAKIQELRRTEAWRTQDMPRIKRELKDIIFAERNAFTKKTAPGMTKALENVR